jgi:hypothetical protein
VVPPWTLLLLVSARPLLRCVRLLVRVRAHVRVAVN